MTNGTTPAQPQPTPPATGPLPGASGRAIATLVLGIMSLVCCGFFCGIPAIILGKQELNAIKEGRSNREGNTIAQLGFIFGIVGTVFTFLAFLLYVILMIFGISLGVMEGVRGA